jgi:hypothetical protein
MSEKKQTRLSYLTFAMLLEELLSGPCTAKHLSEHTGMGHRYMCRLIDALHTKRVVHIAGWDKDALGRVAVRVYGLGPGKDAQKKTKPRHQVNREYRAKEAMAPLRGTAFYGLGARA